MTDLWSSPRREHALTWRIAAVALVVLLAAGTAVALLAGRDGSQVRSPAASGDPQPLIDTSRIISGGPPPDGIPPIDEPKFENVADVGWLTAREPVVAVEVAEDARAYPLQVLTWHEIVNDTVGDVPLSVTFCPLCNTAYAFVRPEVDGEVTTFGTSGKLFNSNLVMYDRATESYWPQAMGQAVVGPLTGTELERVPAQIVSWEDFKSNFPDAKVLSRETGFERPYGENPYVGYDDVDNPPFLFDGEADGRLAPVERVLGVEHADEVMAFPYFRLQETAAGEWSAANTELGGEPLVVLWKKGTTSALDAQQIASSRDVGAAAAFSRRVEGRVLTFKSSASGIVDRETGSRWNLFGEATSGALEGTRLEHLDAHDSFWFDWAAFHPDTLIWSADS
jgi:hypothetical protein